MGREDTEFGSADQPGTARGFSRRDFLLGGALVGASVATAGLIGCSSNREVGSGNAAETVDETDGTSQLGPGQYQARAIGIDEMTVTMEIVDGEIKNVGIDSNESPEIGQLFIPHFIDQILESQTWEIDVVSGATITSFAVREAAQNCIAQALEGADPLPIDDCISPIEPSAVPDQWDLEADVVIVGASFAGLVAAGKLSENGVSVVVLEKEARAGGSGRVTTCIGNYGGNKVWGDGPAYFNDEYHDKDVIDYFEQRAHWTIDPALLKNIVISLREVFDWWFDNGGSFHSLGTWWTGWNPDYSSHTGQRHSACTSAYHLKWMWDLAEGFGARFLMNTPVKRLVMDNGIVIGVEARDRDGNVVYVKGNQAVVLAADNMQRNPKMLEKYGCLAGGTKVGLAKGTGQVIRMGQGAGADMSGLGSFAAQPGQPVPDGTRSLMQVRRGYDCLSYFLANPWCRFDESGRRGQFVIDRIGSTFGDKGNAELGPQNDMIEGFHLQSASDYATGVQYVVLDSRWLDKLNSNGSPMAGNAQNFFDCKECRTDPDYNVSEYFGPYDISESFEQGVEHGLIRTGETLAELAQAMGIDSDILQDVVNAWNEDCDTGEGDPLHGFSAQNMTKVETGPYYGAVITPGLYSSFAGLRVTEKNEVVDLDGNIIPGLYAGFHTAGGIAGENQQMCPVGDQIGSMSASGYNIAKALLGEEWIEI